MRSLALPSLPRVFWFLWAGALINRLGTFVVPFLALYLTSERGLPVETAGVILSLYGLGSLGAAPIGGYLADHLGRRATMALGLGGGALAVLHLGFARGELHLSVATFLVGLLSDLYRPALSAAVADLVPSEDRPRAYGLTYWAANLGFAIALPLGGAIAAKGFWVLFVADAATSMAFALVVLLAVPETRPAEAHGAPRDPLAPMRDLPYLAFVLLFTALATVILQVFSTLPIDMRAHGLSAQQYGVLTALNGILIVLLQPFAERVLRGRPRARVLAGSSLIVGLGMGFNAISGTPLPYAFSISLWTLGEIGLSGLGPTVAADRAPPALRGSYQGLFHMAWSAAACLAPLCGSLVLGRAGSTVLWTGCALLGLLVACGHLLLGPSLLRPRRL